MPKATTRVSRTSLANPFLNSPYCCAGQRRVSRGARASQPRSTTHRDHLRGVRVHQRVARLVRVRHHGDGQRPHATERCRHGALRHAPRRRARGAAHAKTAAGDQDARAPTGHCCRLLQLQAMHVSTTIRHAHAECARAARPFPSAARESRACALASEHTRRRPFSQGCTDRVIRCAFYCAAQRAQKAPTTHHNSISPVQQRACARVERSC
jgi:hypothetical protein